MDGAQRPETGHFLRSRGCMVDDSLSQLFCFDLFISVKEYMYDIYLFLPSPRTYSSDSSYIMSVVSYHIYWLVDRVMLTVE